jgi:hypothetical protein
MPAIHGQFFVFRRRSRDLTLKKQLHRSWPVNRDIRKDTAVIRWRIL